MQGGGDFMVKEVCTGSTGMGWSSGFQGLLRGVELSGFMGE